jgi:putative ABC transport system permease protein
VSADYFKVMEIPVVHGRTFSREDATSPTIIISRATAKRLFGDGDPTGKDVQYGDMRTRTRIVGVVGDARIDNLEQETATMYFPSPPALWGNMTVAIRTAGDPQAAAGLLRQKVKEIDPTQPLANIRTEEQWLENSTAQPRANATLLSIFAFVALALACVGIYGVLSYAVSQRRSEIGVRMALGAQGGHVVKMILAYGLSLAAAGLVLGIGGALALGKLVRTLLFGVSAYDWPTFAMVSAAVIAIAALSAAIPAWKASRVDPVVALRAE